MPQNNSPTEHQEAVAFAWWLRQNGIPFHHSPNETYTKSWNQKRKNKVEGTARGFPDYVLFLPSGTLYIELKRVKGGVLSEHQKEWLLIINDTPGSEAHVAHGAEEAIEIVKKFLTISPSTK